MPEIIPVCQCKLCKSGVDHPERAHHHRLNLLLSRLDERERRWLVALESLRQGDGGQTILWHITGMDRNTIRRGERELMSNLADCPVDGIRGKAEKKR